MDHGDHGSMASMTSMAMSGMTTGTATAASAAAATASKAASGMGGMGMGGNSCKISMLWNWNTIDSCFLAKSWHITSKAMFGGTVVGIFFLCMAIEAVRRAAREYDRRLGLAAAAAGGGKAGPGTAGWEPTHAQHALRTVMYGAQFTAAFLVMLLGMYYNGYVLFAIFLGHTIGYFIFGRDTCGEQMIDSGCAC